MRKALWRYVPTDDRTVVEPFLGSGVFLYNCQGPGIGIDRSGAVIALHSFLRESAAYDYLRYVVDLYFPSGIRTRAGYNKLRDDFNFAGGEAGLAEGGPTFAAMMHVLLQLSFNSLLRFNSKGEYNVGYGRKELDLERLKLSSEVVRARDLWFVAGSYDQKLSYPRHAVFFCDPPYLASKYHYGAWTEDDERRLHAWLDMLHADGQRFVLTSTLRHRGVANPALGAWMTRYHVVHPGGRMRGWSSAVASVARVDDTDEVIVSNFMPEPGE